MKHLSATSPLTVLKTTQILGLWYQKKAFLTSKAAKLTINETITDIQERAASMGGLGIVTLMSTDDIL